jgi:predicted kinase
MGRTVLLSGYPASGKSTLAAQLASELGFALISKDEILAVIFATLSGQPGDQSLVLRSGQAAWAVFWHLASRCPDVVLDTNLKFADPHERAQIASLTGAIVEVRCEIPLKLAQGRYAERVKLRPDAQRFSELTEERAGQYAQPIGVGTLLQIDTTAPVDVTILAHQILRALE